MRDMKTYKESQLALLQKRIPEKYFPLILSIVESIESKGFFLGYRCGLPFELTGLDYVSPHHFYWSSDMQDQRNFHLSIYRDGSGDRDYLSLAFYTSLGRCSDFDIRYQLNEAMLKPTDFSVLFVDLVARTVMNQSLALT